MYGWFFVTILCVCSLANTVNIRNYGDFVKLANDAREGNFNCDVVLETDLDFNDDTLKGILDILPLGKGKDQQCVLYTGTFDGNGRHVKNLKLTTDKDSGFLCGVSDATIKNLIIDDSCTFTGSVVGGIAANISGSVSLYNVNVHASINFEDVGSGLLGQAEHLDTATIMVENSSFHGSIQRSDVSGLCFGGFIGSISTCYNMFLSFERDLNDCTIRRLDQDPSLRPSYLGGYIGRLSGDVNMTVFMRNSVNNIQWNISRYGNVGGWIGSVSGNDVSMTLENNINHISLHYALSNSMVCFGGFIGQTQPSGGSLVVTNNTSNGDVFFTESVYTLYAGGYIGDTTFYREDFPTVFDSNKNGLNFNIDAQISSGTIGGFVGNFVTYSSTTRLFNNLNKGSLNFAHQFSSICYGGLIAFLNANGGTEQKPNSIRIINNLNEGNAYFSSQSGSCSYAHYIGGLVGRTALGSIDLLYESNRNNGRIEGVLSSGSSYVGGVFGQLSSSGNLTLRGNSNNALVNISIPYADYCDYGFVGGVVGYFLNVYQQITLFDNSNYGDIISTCSQRTLATCGLICGNGYNSIVTLGNCVNDASVKGTNAYGISNFVATANNIVSMGEVSGSEESYSFWESSKETPTSIYGLNNKCKNCDGNVTLFAKDSSDGKYHMVSGKKAIVNSLLNDEAGKNGYNLRWDDALHLREQVTVHIGGPSLNIDLTVLSGTPLGDVEELKKYLDSEDYAVGDKDKNEVLDKTSPITSSVNIVVVERHVVVIEIEKGTIPSIDVNITELAELISLLTGISKDDILIELVVDENGYILRVLLILPSDELGEVALKSINDMIKAKDKGCTYGILCHAREARILVEGQSISGAGRTIICNEMFLINLVIFMAMMMK